MKRVSLTAALLAGLTFLGSSEALAETANSAAAEALFNEGRRLLETQDYDAACAKFAESQRLDPGTGTLLNLATCYESAGKKATAWLTWLEAARSARQAGQSEREAGARSRAQELEKELGRLVVNVRQPVADNLVVERNGEELSSGAWGIPLPLDAGTYRITARAPGHGSFEGTANVRDGEQSTFEIPPLSSTAEPTPAPTSSAGASASEPGSSQRTWGYVVGGVGVLGIGVGSALGILAISKNDESKQHCDTSDATRCSQTGVDLRNEALGYATGSTIGWAVGAAALVTGAVLILTAPSANTEIAAAPTWGGGSLVFRGSFQ